MNTALTNGSSAAMRMMVKGRNPKMRRDESATGRLPSGFALRGPGRVREDFRIEQRVGIRQHLCALAALRRANGFGVAGVVAARALMANGVSHGSPPGSAPGSTPLLGHCRHGAAWN